MQIRLFTFPIAAEEKDVEELNHFLRSHKIIDVRRELAVTADSCFWTFCITYMADTRPQPAADALGSSDRQGKVDYKDVLDSDAFDRFARMRKLRKQIAEKEAVPAYAVFTDAELAEMAKLEVLDIGSMLKIPRIGKKKVEKYGSAFCQIDQITAEDETGGAPDRADS